MDFLLGNWKLILIAILIASTAMMFKLWQNEVKDFAEFKGAVVVLGQEAEKEAKRINDLHDKTLKETRDEWNKQLPGIRNIAIDNYMRRFPRGLCGNASSSEMSGQPNSTEASNGAKPERMASDDFIAECAKDAGKLKSLRYWVTQNKLPIEK